MYVYKFSRLNSKQKKNTLRYLKGEMCFILKRFLKYKKLNMGENLKHVNSKLMKRQAKVELKQLVSIETVKNIQIF